MCCSKVEFFPKGSKENEKGKVNQFDVGNKKDQHITKPGHAYNTKSKDNRI